MSFQNHRSTVPSDGNLARAIKSLRDDLDRLEARQQPRGIQVPLFSADDLSFANADAQWHGLFYGNAQGVGIYSITVQTNSCAGCSFRLVVNSFAQPAVPADRSITLTAPLDASQPNSISLEVQLTAASPVTFRIAESRIS